MIAKFIVKNFKSLHDLTFDLSFSGEAKHMALIYGENGAGKSQIISALYMLLRTFRTLKSEDEVFTLTSINYGYYPELLSEEIKYRLSSASISLKEIARRSLPIGSDDDIYFSLDFSISDKKGTYSLLLSSDGRVVEERLSFQLGKRKGILFQSSEDSLFLSPSVFKDKDYKKELDCIHSRNDRKHTFFALLFSEWERINREEFENKVSPSLISVMDMLWNISVYSEEGEIVPRYIPSLASGYADAPSAIGLDRVEKLFSSYASKLFKDVKRVYYRTSCLSSRMHYELVFVREIGGQIIEVPLSAESKGTKDIAKFFPYIVSSLVGGICFVDGLGEGLHDLVLKELIDRLYESVSGQIVMTMHSTYLMQKLDRNCLYVLQVDGHGFKKISSVPSYSFRTQKNNNVQIKYLKGDYGGIPLLEKINLKALADQINRNPY